MFFSRKQADTEKIQSSHPAKGEMLKAASQMPSRSRIVLAVGLVSLNFLIWVSAIIYLRFSDRTYTSQMILSLPGMGSTTEVGLPNIGNASYNNWSPYAGASYDPREDYKLIAQSGEIVRKSASVLNISPEEFGVPTVAPKDNTTVIEFSFNGSSPEESKQKATVFYSAFQEKLSDLRNKDIETRERDFQASLENSRRNVQEAEFLLSKYQADSGLSSQEQVIRLAQNIQDLRKELAVFEAQNSEASARNQDLSSTLGLSTEMADYAFTIQADEVFQRTYLDYQEASAEIVRLSAEFTPEYVGVAEAKAKQDATRQFLISRGRALLGNNLSWEELEGLSLLGTAGSARKDFLEELIRANTDSQGLEARSTELRGQIFALEQQLADLVEKRTTFNSLQRNLTIAEAVFSSTLAKADIARSNLYASYPPVQMLSEPSLPSEASSPNSRLILAASLLASFFVTTGLIIFWIYGVMPSYNESEQHEQIKVP